MIIKDSTPSAGTYAILRGLKTTAQFTVYGVFNGLEQQSFGIVKLTMILDEHGLLLGVL